MRQEVYYAIGMALNFPNEWIVCDRVDADGLAWFHVKHQRYTCRLTKAGNLKAHSIRRDDA